MELVTLATSESCFTFNPASLVRTIGDKVRMSDPVCLFSPLMSMHVRVGSLLIPNDSRIEVFAATDPYAFTMHKYCDHTWYKDADLLQDGAITTLQFVPAASSLCVGIVDGQDRGFCARSLSL